jgi:hypothetical protein
VIRLKDPGDAGHRSAACPVASTSILLRGSWGTIRFLQYLTLLVLGVIAVIVTELAGGSSTTSRVLTSIKLAVWTIVALLCLAGAIVAASWLRSMAEAT